MMYTSYYANVKNLPESIIPISIAGKAPEGYKGLEYKRLAPKYGFFSEWKKSGDNEYYIKCFKEQVLKPLNIFEVLGELAQLRNSIEGGSNKKICLICYEKPDDFCHRHLVAEWLRSNKVPCREWDKDRWEWDGD